MHDIWQFEKSHDASKNPKRVLASGEKPFLGMTIVLSGRLSRKQVSRFASFSGVTAPVHDFTKTLHSTRN